jgi:hypothetical protein
MDALVSSALMIRLSLQPSPAYDTSAFNKIRAFSRRWAALLPFRISASLALLNTQPHNVLLYRNLLHSHVPSP